VLASGCAFGVPTDIPVVFASAPAAGARKIERWPFYFASETLRSSTIFGGAERRLTPIDYW